MLKPKQLLTGAVGVLLVLLLIEGGRLVSADDNIVIELNGQPLQLAQEPLLVGDTVYVSVRDLAEAVQAPVYWEPLKKQILLLHEGQAETIELTADKAEAGNIVFANAGVVYMPLFQLTELLGLDYDWDGQNSVAWLSSKTSELVTAAEPVTIDLAEAAAGNDTVWLKAGGRYLVSGSLEEGQLRIQTSEPVYLQLRGCVISNSDWPAIYAEGGGLVQIEAVDGEVNILESGGLAAIAVDGALEICGEGSLEITAENGAGISAGSFVRLAGADISIAAATDGVHAGRLVLADAGKLQVRANQGVGFGTGLYAGEQVFINGGELVVAEVNCGVRSEHIVMINGGSLNIAAAGAGISAGASTYSIQTANVVIDDQLGSWSNNESWVVVVKLDNETELQEDDCVANIFSGELSPEQHIGINGGELVINSGGAAVLSQGSIEQRGGVAVLYAAKSRAMAAGGVLMYDGGTLLAADGGQTLGETELHPASGGSWLDIALEALLPTASEITIVDAYGQTLWSYQAAGDVAHLLFADSILEPEAAYQVLVNGEPYMACYAE